MATVFATQAEGVVLIHEWMFEGRLYFVDTLTREMGARIVLADPHRAVVMGPSKLRAAEVRSPDIRAGMALLAAALCAKGTSVINNVEQIDRGYEELDTRLRGRGGRHDARGGARRRDARAPERGQCRLRMGGVRGARRRPRDRRHA